MHPTYNYPLQTKSQHKKFFYSFMNSSNPMQFHLSFCCPHPCRSSSQLCKPLFPIRKARFTVSATMTQLQDSVTATRTNMYDLLGVREKASPEEIKAAYKRQARKWHPDVCVSDTDKQFFAQQFMMARQAYETLSDPELRIGYDLVLLRKGSGHGQQDCRRFRDWESQLKGLKNRSDRDGGRESWGSRMRKAQYYGHSN